MRTTLVLIYLLSTSSIALASNTPLGEERSGQISPVILDHKEYINEDNYHNADTFEGLKTNILENGNISFNYCSYERVNKDIIKDCSLHIGNPEGYSQSVAAQKLLGYSKEKPAHAENAHTIAGLALIYSGIVGGMLLPAVIMEGSHQNLRRFPKILMIGSMLAVLVGSSGVAFYLMNDDLKEQQELIKNAYENSPANNQLVLIEDFDSEKLVDHLSRSLKNN